MSTTTRRRSNEQIGVLDADTLVAMQSDLVLGEADALDRSPTIRSGRSCRPSSTTT